MVRHLPVIQSSSATGERLSPGVHAFGVAVLSGLFWLPVLGFLRGVGPLALCLLFGAAAALSVAALNSRARVRGAWKSVVAGQVIVTAAIFLVSMLGGIGVGAAALGSASLFVSGLVGASAAVFLLRGAP